MQRVVPTPRTLTLRFKHHRTTILIEADPIQSLSDVRAELLHALNDTNSSGKLNGVDIPKAADDIILGRAVDRNKLSLGFTSIDRDSDDTGSSGKGKGKSTAKPLTGQMKDCPQGAGLRNGDVVAFKFKDDVEEDDDGNEQSPEKWNVVIPTMEETYGDDQAHDEGVGLEEG